MIVDLIGGLGNQMFQYAFGRSVSLARNIPLQFSQRPLLGRRGSHIQFMLDVYDLNAQYDNTLVSRPTFAEPSPRFCQDVYTAPVDALYTGYWQTEKYFNTEIIRRELMTPKGTPSLQNQRLASQMSSLENSTFIQVRRGDYLNPGTRAYHGLQPLEYYLTGALTVNVLYPNAEFFVFSDDPQWCKEVFPPEFHIIDENRWQDRTAQWDLWLMSKCRHGVMANSSFGWWGAWLGDTRADRIIVAPKKWFDKAGIDESDIVPERWIRI